MTSQYSQKSARRSTRHRRNNVSRRSQNKQKNPQAEVPPTANSDKRAPDPTVINTKDQPVNKGGTQSNDLQRRKKISTRRGKTKGTQRSQKGRTVVERRRLNDIFPKAEDTTDGGEIGDNIQQCGAKLRASQRSAKGSVRRKKSSRKLKKNLFPSPAVFSQIDANAIKAGEEVRLSHYHLTLISVSDKNTY